MSTPVEVSVVIPAFNAAETIGEQLNALSRQLDAPSFEVIVSDNGSTDDTAAVVARFTGEVAGLRTVDAGDRRGPSHARNVGAARANGQIVLLCDADDVVGPDWVASLATTVRDEGFATGPSQYVAAEEPISWPLRYTGRSVPRLYLERLPFADSANLGITKELFELLGGFDEELTCGEDADLSIRALALGVSIGWSPGALMAVRRRESLRGSFPQFYRYGEAAPVLLSRHECQFNAVRPVSVREFGANWAKLLLTAPRVLSASRRRAWLQSLADRLGRTVGSLRQRTLCP